MNSTEKGSARSPANLASSSVMTGIREHQMLAGLFSPGFNDLAAIFRKPHGTTKAATLPRSVRAFLPLTICWVDAEGCLAEIARFRQPPAGERAPQISEPHIISLKLDCPHNHADPSGAASIYGTILVTTHLCFPIRRDRSKPSCSNIHSAPLKRKADAALRPSVSSG